MRAPRVLTEAIKSASGRELSDPLVQDGILHLINSGPAALDGTGQCTGDDGRPAVSFVSPGFGDEMVYVATRPGSRKVRNAVSPPRSPNR